MSCGLCLLSSLMYCGLCLLGSFISCGSACTIRKADGSRTHHTSVLSAVLVPDRDYVLTEDPDNDHCQHSPPPNFEEAVSEQPPSYEEAILGVC
jgi:hypothetical protein